MGNTHVIPWSCDMKPTDAITMYPAINVHVNGYLTLKELMTTSGPGPVVPRFLPALSFSNENKDGCLTEPECEALV